MDEFGELVAPLNLALGNAKKFVQALKNKSVIDNREVAKSLLYPKQESDGEATTSSWTNPVIRNLKQLPAVNFPKNVSFPLSRFGFAKKQSSVKLTDTNNPTSTRESARGSTLKKRSTSVRNK